MTSIPKKLREDLASDPFYHVCAHRGLHGHECDGRITWDHSLIFAGRQVQKKFAITPLCAKAHSVDLWQDRGDLNKEINEWIALNRATDEELLEISRARDYFLRRHWLNKRYGVYKPVDMGMNNPGINYGFDVEKKEVFPSGI